MSNTSSSTTTSKLDPHQLRPYYDHDTFDAGYSVIFKKGVGLFDPKTNKPITSNLSSNVIDKQINNNLHNQPGLIRRTFDRQGGLGLQSSGSGDKNFLYDLEFNEYFDTNNILELLKNLVWNFVKSYAKVLIAQPLEITRLVLQVGKFPNLTDKKPTKDDKSKKRLLDSTHSLSSSTSSVKQENDHLSSSKVGFAQDDDEPIDYFQPQNDQQVWANPQSTFEPMTPAKELQHSSTVTSNEKFVPPPLKRLSTRKRIKVFKIQPVSLHTIDIMSAIANKDSFFALFRGVNASFIYQTLSNTIEAWITGFLSPFLGIPDPFFLDLTHSNDPLKSLWLSVSACVLTGIILMPLDLIRIKFMITQPNNTLPLHQDKNEDLIEKAAEDILQNTRSIRESIRFFPTYYLKHPPSPIVLLTTLYQLSTSIFRKMAPYLLFIKFNIDSYSSPSIYTFVNLISSICEFFIKLPVENLLRKEQVKFLLTPKAQDPKKIITIVKPEENLIVEFNGNIGEDLQDKDESVWVKIKQLGLFNGWRVGLLNVVGFWGYNILKNSGNELREERL
ncbi:hypothetical protein KGF54_000943 [Candida jiufengensis]|uniref:uncharacterized protein n=1 Tax=Candida jiufengensis TaxID=497108 RepID=UPI0022254B5F|nr:uncharacterized protein KGF54_000943 [Candida jiufengensis]KAI5956468.1 hypothetical protein KGF54_000943 [Candida jiufengensis]